MADTIILVDESALQYNDCGYEAKCDRQPATRHSKHRPVPSRVPCCYCGSCVPTSRGLIRIPNRAGFVTWFSDPVVRTIVFTDYFSLTKIRHQKGCLDLAKVGLTQSSSILMHLWQMVLPCSQLDSCLGILMAIVTVWIAVSSHRNQRQELVMFYVEKSTLKLTSLLNFLSNHPCGLKLHQPSINLIVTLFSHQMSLWSSCLLYILALPWALLVTILGSIGGMSCLIATLRDCIFVFNLSIFLFQAYSARTFMFIRFLLSGQLHTFIYGQRNPLTGLRDPLGLYDMDELCVSTLTVTICLFLLPTALIFYFVFTFCRLVFVAVDWTLTELCYKNVVCAHSDATELNMTVLQIWNHPNQPPSRPLASDVLPGSLSSDVVVRHQVVQTTFRLTTKGKHSELKDLHVHTYSLSKILADLLSGRELRSSLTTWTVPV